MARVRSWKEAAPFTQRAWWAMYVHVRMAAMRAVSVSTSPAVSSISSRVACIHPASSRPRGPAIIP